MHIRPIGHSALEGIGNRLPSELIYGHAKIEVLALRVWAWDPRGCGRPVHFWTAGDSASPGFGNPGALKSPAPVNTPGFEAAEVRLAR